MNKEINLKNGSKIMDVKSKEKVKGFPKQKCNYPGCKKEGCYMQPFTIINEDSSSIELLFCQYHHLIVMGGHFKAKIINEEINLLGEKLPWNFELRTL